MSAITAKASRKMKKYAVLTREPRCFLGSFDFSWEQRIVGDLLIERNQQAPMSDEYPLMAFIANEGVAPKGERYDRSALVTDTVNKLYKKTEKGDFIYSSNNLETGSIGLNKYGKACISPVYSIFEPTGIADSDFLGRRLVRKDFINAMVKWRQGVIYGQWRIHESDFLKIEIPVPSVEEQRKIGAYLDQLDNLITLHQRKCALLFSPFQALISMMFTTSTFSWEQRKLGELALFNPKDELPQIFEYVDLESVVGTEMLSHRTEVKSSAPSRAQRLAHTGDLFYQTVRPYQKNNYLFEKPDNNYVFSTGYAQMRPYVDGYFLLSLVQSERFVKVVLDNCTGTSYPAINANDLAEIEVAAPSDESEAQKIGTIFRSIDNLITLHQRKFEKLTNVKKSMLEKMFPQNGSSYPEIRFKGFTDPWEQRKLCDVVKEITRNDPESEAPIMMITANNGFIEQSERYAFNNAGESLKKYILLKKGELAYNHGASKLRPYGSCFALTTAENARIPFVYHCFSAENQNAEFMSIELNGAEIENQLRKIVSSGARMDGLLNISFDEYTSVSVLLPGIEEQDCIADFFRQLDNLITLHQRELEKLQNIKKSMLEKMFV